MTLALQGLKFAAKWGETVQAHRLLMSGGPHLLWLQRIMRRLADGGEVISAEHCNVPSPTFNTGDQSHILALSSAPHQVECFDLGFSGCLKDTWHTWSQRLA